MTRFEFATATRIVFGAGALSQAGSIAQGFGRSAFLVTGSKPQRAQPLRQFLKTSGLGVTSFAVPGEPEIADVEAGAALAKEAGSRFVISFGGGSAIDAGKAIAAMLANSGEVLDYVELIGRGKTLAKPSVPFIAVPTTAGTGSEVTRNAVLASPPHKVKVSLRSPFMLPSVALVDPELAYDLPQAITASTGLDALTQLIEPYVSCRANPITDALCLEGMTRAARSLRRAFENGHDIAVREDMSIASLFGGLALANAGLGAVHGFAGPIGGMFPAPHGVICANLLAPAIAANVQAVQQRQPGSEGLQRYDTVARVLTGNPAAKGMDSVQWVRSLVRDLHVPPLADFGITREHTQELISKAAQASSMKANPIALTPDELTRILESAL
jgi:alcohol dehydrogenase class IV